MEEQPIARSEEIRTVAGASNNDDLVFVAFDDEGAFKNVGMIHTSRIRRYYRKVRNDRL